MPRLMATPMQFYFHLAILNKQLHRLQPVLMYFSKVSGPVWFESAFTNAPPKLRLIFCEWRGMQFHLVQLQLFRFCKWTAIIHDCSTKTGNNLKSCSHSLHSIHLNRHFHYHCSLEFSPLNGVYTQPPFKV